MNTSLALIKKKLLTLLDGEEGHLRFSMTIEWDMYVEERTPPGLPRIKGEGDLGSQNDK